jgi:hypothetical protein
VYIRKLRVIKREPFESSNGNEENQSKGFSLDYIPGYNIIITYFTQTSEKKKDLFFIVQQTIFKIIGFLFDFFVYSRKLIDKNN